MYLKNVLLKFLDSLASGRTEQVTHSIFPCQVVDLLWTRALTSRCDLATWARAAHDSFGRQEYFSEVKDTRLSLVVPADGCLAASHCDAAASDAPGVPGAEAGRRGTEAVLLVARIVAGTAHAGRVARPCRAVCCSKL